jgi:hypothetical protein
VLGHFRTRTSQQDLPGDQSNRNVSTTPTIAPVLESALLRS